MNRRNQMRAASDAGSRGFEQEARRLRTAYINEVLVRLAIAIDLNARRVAHRLLAALRPGATPCR